jgi:AcrR family transcriptional regulator
VPRLTDARKELRRAQITDAAVRCFGRAGLEQTSIADITAESGLSPGSIYAHYRGKAEIVRAAARTALAEKAEVLGGWATGERPPGPDELLARLVAAKGPTRARVAVQTWAAATVDPAVREVVVDMRQRVRALLRDCVVAWLVQVEGHEPAAADELADPVTDDVVARYQAALLSAALRAPDEEDPA